METTMIHEPTQQQPEPDDSGQAALSISLILSMFLLAALGFSDDITNIWFHRQAAMAAADAACQAGALDMLAMNSGLSLASTGFTAGTASDCAHSSSATMCAYAGFNGYSGTGLTAGAASNSVSWSFPSSVTGVTPGVGTYPFITLTISENVKTYLMPILTGSYYQNINVSSTCGIATVNSAAPMVVLHPTMSGAFNYSGGGELDIIGGPGRGLQVNSSSATGILWAASGIIDLSKGGPSQTGSDSAVVGGPTTAPTNGSSNGYKGGTTGLWKSNVLPVADPFGSVPAPATVKSLSPTLGTSGTWVAYHTNGCPDNRGAQGTSSKACLEFSPGYYPAGINVSTLVGGNSTAIFDPGIYYLNGSLTAGASDILRMAKPSGYQQTDGVMFYFLSGALALSGCSGCSASNVDTVSTTDLTCNGAAPPTALNMGTSIYGNVLYGQCTKNGTYWDSGGDTTDSRSATGSRGILIFQDHGNTSTPTFSGSGALAFSGAIYLHSTTYADVLNLNGGASSGTFILGEIIADQVNLSGSGLIKLALNPAATTSLSKVSIFN
jgi:hypothetical protein